MTAKRTFQDVSVGLSEADRTKLGQLAAQRGVTKTVLAREAIRFYLDNLEQLKDAEREGKTAQAITYATDQLVKAMLSTADRICGMLARLGAEVGTLYEIMWRACATDEAKEEFIDAAKSAKQRQRTRLENDERAIAERTKKVITS